MWSSFCHLDSLCCEELPCHRFQRPLFLKHPFVRYLSESKEYHGLDFVRNTTGQKNWRQCKRLPSAPWRPYRLVFLHAFDCLRCSSSHHKTSVFSWDCLCLLHVSQCWKGLPSLHTPETPETGARRLVRRSHTSSLLQRLHYGNLLATLKDLVAAKFSAQPKGIHFLWFLSRILYGLLEGFQKRRRICEALALNT